MSGPGTQVQVGGDVVGQLVVGDHNITVWAEHSVVTVVAPGQRPEPVRRTVVSLLPRRPARPVGRDRELAALRAAVTGARLAQIYGAPGAGKSTLLRYAARELGLPNTVFLAAAGRTPGDLLQDVFEACYDTAGYRPSPVELRRLLSGMDLCLLLDDLELPDDQHTELLDALPDAAVAFTGRQRQLWADGQAQELLGLPWEAALDLLTGALGHALNETEQQSARQLWHAARGLPVLLLQAVAGARRVPDGRLTLPPTAELGELLPRIFAALGRSAHAVLSVLALAQAPVSTELVAWLADAQPGTLAELIAQGLVTGGDAVALAPGVADRLPAGLTAIPQLELVADRIAATLPRWSPAQAADHAGLLAGVADAAARLGRPDVGARLAKLAAPRLACSGRLGAWQQMLVRGRAAAEKTGDRSLLAYFTHEAGILALVTGQAAVAAASLAAAITLWQQLGHTAHAAAAQHSHALAAAHPAALTPVAQPPMAHPAAAPQPPPPPHPPTHPAPAHAASPQPSGGHAPGHSPGHGAHAGGKSAKAVKTAKAAKGASAGAKTGMGLGVKVTVACVATAVVVGGGYVVTRATTTGSPTAASSPSETAQSTAPGSTGEQPIATSSQRMGVIPETCPTDPFFGEFTERDPAFMVKALPPGSHDCFFDKDRWSLQFAMIPGAEDARAACAEAHMHAIEIPGTDLACLARDSSIGEGGDLALAVGNRSLQFQYVGTDDDAIAAAKRYIGL